MSRRKTVSIVETSPLALAVIFDNESLPETLRAKALDRIIAFSGLRPTKAEKLEIEAWWDLRQTSTSQDTSDMVEKYLLKKGKLGR